MATATTAPTITSKFSTDEDSSQVKVETNVHADNAYISNTFEVFASSDTDDNQIYLSARQHDYASIDGFETISKGFDVIAGHHFTREEAEAIVQALSTELARL